VDGCSSSNLDCLSLKVAQNLGKCKLRHAYCAKLINPVPTRLRGPRRRRHRARVSHGEVGPSNHLLLDLQPVGVVYVASSGSGGQGRIFQFAVSDHRGVAPAATPSTAWVEDQHVFSGDTIKVPVWLDVSGSGQAAGWFDAGLSWDTTKVAFVEITGADWAGVFTPDLASVSQGTVSFVATNPDGAENTDSTRAAELEMVILQAPGDTTRIDLHVSSLLSTGETDLSIGMSVYDALLSTGVGMWGDASGDGSLTSLDALMCLTAVVGGLLPVGSDASACDVAPDLDLNQDGEPESYDGTVTALDALAILTQIVAKPLPAAFRAGRPR